MPSDTMDRVVSWFSRHRSISVIVAMALFAVVLPLLVLLPPLSGFNRQGVWINNFNGAGIFVLLARADGRLAPRGRAAATLLAIFTGAVVLAWLSSQASPACPVATAGPSSWPPVAPRIWLAGGGQW